MDDRKLLSLIKKDPDAGMEKLLTLYSGYVFAVVKSRLDGVCDSAETEDCVSDVFISFYERLGSFNENGASIKNYLCVLARNIAVDCYRKKQKTVLLSDEEAETEDVSAEALERVTASELVEKIEALGRPDSEIIIRKYWYGETSEKTAKALGMTPAAVDTRRHRAVLKLKTMLEEE